ncbi:MAG: hypothetical protein DYG96_15825 [Chlorobi bacterium CHB2]|nr:hypothetical protein [Chlorobi bacterium CHB2]
MRTDARYLIFLFLLAAIWLGTATQSAAQISIYPTVLYAGLNSLTIRAPRGVMKVERRQSGVWGPFVTGQESRDLRIITSPIFARCATSAQFITQVKTISRTVSLHLRVTDCSGETEEFVISTEYEWRISREDFGKVKPGEVACHEFHVITENHAFVVDSIVSPSPLFTIKFLQRKPPVKLPENFTYRYQVCFKSNRPGGHKVPMLVYLRRDQPSGGFSNYIVADTAYVSVVGPPPSPPTPPRPRPVPPRPRPRPRPRPQPVPVKPPDTPAVRLALATPAPQLQQPAPLAIAEHHDHIAAPQPMAATAPPEIIIDPAAHRLILGPTGRSVEEGEGFLANYDGAGWLAGYAPVDRLTLLAGALYVPSFINYSLTASAGGRYEVVRAGAVRAAVGVQGHYSESEISTIVAASPYASVSIGDDDSRATLSGAYSWRHHSPTYEAPFDRSAFIVGGGMDRRIGRHWKAIVEAYWLQDSDYLPLGFALRWFNNRFAVDLGLNLNLPTWNNPNANIIPAPVISGTWAW